LAPGALGGHVLCTLHTALHCTALHTAHCTLHTAHCTLHCAHIMLLEGPPTPLAGPDSPAEGREARAGEWGLVAGRLINLCLCL
jgi:hypothetical protein